MRLLDADFRRGRGPVTHESAANDIWRSMIVTHQIRARRAGAPGTLTFAGWIDIVRFYNYTCVRCGLTDVKLSPDHVIPISQGGRHDASNIQPLCVGCNLRKGRRARHDYRPRNI
jgi:5-methylcytosine-specific restriction endonuclease McrA